MRNFISETAHLVKGVLNPFDFHLLSDDLATEDHILLHHAVDVLKQHAHTYQTVA